LFKIPTVTISGSIIVIIAQAEPIICSNLSVNKCLNLFISVLQLWRGDSTSIFISSTYAQYAAPSTNSQEHSLHVHVNMHARTNIAVFEACSAYADVKLLKDISVLAGIWIRIHQDLLFSKYVIHQEQEPQDYQDYYLTFFNLSTSTYLCKYKMVRLNFI